MSIAAAVVATITATSTIVTAAAEVCTQDTYTVAKGSAAMYAQYVHRGEGVKEKNLKHKKVNFQNLL